MKKNNSNKTIAVLAIMIMIISLSIGFASFAEILKISSSAVVEPNASNFSVSFSLNENETILGELSPIDGIGQTAIVTENVITNLQAKFINADETVNYKLYVRNAGEMNAYLKNINIENFSDGKIVKCTPREGTTDSYVQDVCDYMKLDITLKINDEIHTTSNESLTNIVENNILKKGQSAELDIKIKYDLDDDGNAHLADGIFDVLFGDIKLDWQSVN